MWHRAIAVPEGVEVGEHGFDLFTVDLRCDPWKHPAPHAGCACIGDLTYMAICEPHAWRVIASDENAAVEGWHDHAFPGWRDLPVVPARLRNIGELGLSKAARKWVEQRYPTSMQVVGAPVITERSGYVLQGADVHIALARLALARGDKRAAREHAREGHHLATCDGPPDYTYAAAYAESGALLSSL